MISRGRQTEGSNVSYINARQRPLCPPQVDGAKRILWDKIVAEHDPDYFTEANLPLLEQYCSHVTEARRINVLVDNVLAVNPGNFDYYKDLLMARQREINVATNLATKLRLTKQSTHNRSGNKQPKGGGARPWD